ncbi:MAG TPA: efflux RND transporter permease subunit [Candidatus Eremiobacteraceae bacterium]|nr:efflux RND transporter permease subunit [Candidatus Eremiobacteraceae bacterium]
MWLTRFAIKNPTIITLFFIAVALFGLVAYFSMGQNIDPNVQIPVVNVTATYSGASPEEMERLVVRPIEDELENVPHLDHIDANVDEGLANITVELKLGTDVNFAATDVQQAVDAARINLPSDLDPPVVTKADVNGDPIISEGITTKTLSPVAMADLINNEIVPYLRGVSGVSAATAGGTYDRQVTIEPDLARLQALGGTLNDVVSAVGAGNVSFPGGRLDQPFQEATVGVRADITDPKQIARLPLTIPGQPEGVLHVGDVATVVDGYADHRIASSLDGHDAIVMQVVKDADADTKGTTAAVRDAFKTLQSRYPQVTFTELNADYDFMHDSINGVLQNLFEGILLTALVLLFFLHVWRSALVVMIAIPTSLLATFFVMKMLGFTIDVLSLMGLSLTVGILVDDSIVVIENITRHRAMGRSADDAAITGRTEIGAAAIAITLVDVVVFTPIAFMSGIIGQFLREFALVIVVATLFSLLVSFTLTPLLAAKWALRRKPIDINAPRPDDGRPSFTRMTAGPVGGFSRWFETLRKSYHDVALPWAMRHPYLVFFGSWGLVFVAIAMLFMQAVPAEFQPSTDWGFAIVQVTYPPGTPIGTTQSAVLRMEPKIQQMGGVQSVSATVGQKSGTIGGNVAELYVTMDPKMRHLEDQVVNNASASLGSLAPGARIDAFHGDTGGQAPIQYNLAGPPDAVQAAADKLKAYIAKNPVAMNVQTSTQVAGPRMEIAIDRDRASLLHVSPDNAASAARAAVGGTIATKLRLTQGLVNAVVQLPPSTRNSQQILESVQVRSDSGMLVPLSDIANFTWTKEPSQLTRRDRQRIVSVTAATKNGAPIGQVTTQVDKLLATPGYLPPGVTMATQGDTQLLGELFTDILMALGTSFLLIYMLLVVLYRNYLTPIVMMVSLPVAFIGVVGILAFANGVHTLFPDWLFFKGQTLNIFSMLGIVMLMGLVAKNGILLVDYANTMRARGLELHEAMRESAVIRFRPIVMTTLSMIFGMLPLALGLTEGAEFRKSLGTVIIGGLASSLFLTLFLVPVVYVSLVGFADRLARARQKRLAAVQLEEEAEDRELAQV